MFDRDLQEIIQKENSEFIEQALERAAAEDEKPREVTLSALEQAALYSQIDDVSLDALHEYQTRARFPDEPDSADFRRRLMRQGLFQLDQERFVPSGYGMLLFAKEPRTAMPQSGLLATIHYPDGSEEVRDFDGPQVLVPELSLGWLKDKLPNVIDRSKAKRIEKNEPLFEIVREGIVNALVHRDYGIAGAKCQLVVSSDKIEIRSPGLPVEPITLEQLQSFSAPMLSRNPVLHYVFAKMDLAEERGLGLKSMKKRAEDTGLPLPRYSWEDPYLVLTVLPSVGASTSTLPPHIQDALKDKEFDGWQWLSTKGRTKSVDYAEAVGVDTRTARRHLNRFAELGLLRKTGAARATEYEVI